MLNVMDDLYSSMVQQFVRMTVKFVWFWLASSDGLQVGTLKPDTDLCLE